MRCGVNTEGKEVFCRECLASMEKYPVKPGTPIHIFSRAAAVEQKKALKKRRDITPDEQISRLRNMLRKLTAALIAALVLIMVLSGILLVSSLEENPQTPSPRNYTATEGR